MEKDCCCPELKKEDWDLKKHDWNRRAFYRTGHKVLFHMPIGISGAISKGFEDIKTRGYTFKEPFIMLDEEVGLFSANMLMAIEDMPKDDPNIVIWEPSTLYSKYYHGEFKGLKKEIDELISHVENTEKKKPVSIYTWTANCPKCWKKQGGPTTIIFARI